MKADTVERRGLKAFWKKDSHATNKSSRDEPSVSASATSLKDRQNIDRVTPSVSASSSSSASSVSTGENEHDIVPACNSDFVVECDGGTMVFVTAAQSYAVLRRSQYLRDALARSPNRVIKKGEWSLATTRRVIELLANGSTWIEQSADTFHELVRAGTEVGLDLRMASLINYHDTLSRQDTQRFFDMVRFDRFQFRLRATVQSWQWQKLMQNGILLMSKAKVLMIKSVESERERDTPSRDTSLVPKAPSTERLAKCDRICSEFCVYANGKLDVLWTILQLLDASTRPTPGASVHEHQTETFRLVYYSREGSLEREVVDQIWRLTAASYTEARAEDRKYLDPIPTSVSDDKRQSADAECCAFGPLHCRSITSPSVLVLKHLFESMNCESEPDGRLPACLFVSCPTPDTLGRLINAAVFASRKKKRTDEAPTRQAEIGMHLQRRLYYVSRTSSEIHDVLESLADYSSSAVVSEEFRMAEYNGR